MPFCDDCDKFWNPNSLPPDGRCPTCGIQIAEPQELLETDDEDDYAAPWHFKLMVALTVIYLGWRFLQLSGILPQ